MYLKLEVRKYRTTSP